MIALGKWGCSVNTMFYTGDIVIDVFDDNGKYGFEITAVGINVPQINIISVTESENTIDAIVEASALPGKQIPIHADFFENSFEGYVKVPIFGKVPFKNCHRIG